MMKNILSNSFVDRTGRRYHNIIPPLMSLQESMISPKIQRYYDAEEYVIKASIGVTFVRRDGKEGYDIALKNAKKHLLHILYRDILNQIDEIRYLASNYKTGEIIEICDQLEEDLTEVD